MKALVGINATVNASLRPEEHFVIRRHRADQRLVFSPSGVAVDGLHLTNTVLLHLQIEFRFTSSMQSRAGVIQLWPAKIALFWTKQATAQTTEPNEQVRFLVDTKSVECLSIDQDLAMLKMATSLMSAVVM